MTRPIEIPRNADSLPGANRVKADRSPKLQSIAALTSDSELLDELYFTFLSRRPTTAERASGIAHLTKAGNRASAVEDLAWMCINKVEFLFSY